MNIADVLVFKYPDCEWSCGDDYKSISWKRGNPKPKPTLAELKAGHEELLIHRQNMAYKKLRASEYPPIEEQLDMIYHDRKNGTAVWDATISAIKTKYSKPTE